MTAPVTREQVFAWLDDVKDPEVPVLSVVELGVVRDAIVSDDGGIAVTITPTYSGCPAMRVIEESIRDALLLHGAPRVTVTTVFTPAWTTDWIPAAARAKLEAYGIAPPGPAATSDELVPLRRANPVLRCPYCKSQRTTIRSDFGSTSCKSLWMCETCTQPFEAFKAI